MFRKDKIESFTTIGVAPQAARFSCDDDPAPGPTRIWYVLHRDVLYLHRSKGQACQYAHIHLEHLPSEKSAHIGWIPDAKGDDRPSAWYQGFWWFFPVKARPPAVLLGLGWTTRTIDCRKKWKKPPRQPRRFASTFWSV